MSEHLGADGMDGLEDDRPMNADAADEEWSAMDEMDGMDGMDEGDGADALDEGFDAGDDSFDVGDDGFEAQAMDDNAAFVDEFDQFDGGDDTGDAWDAFEEELADALDADDGDEFLGRLLGGLGRAAGRVARSPVARRVAGAAGRVGSAARTAGAVAGNVGNLAGAAASLARSLGANQAAQALGQVGGHARQAQSVAGRVGRAAGAVQRAPAAARRAGQAMQQGAANPMGFLLGQLGQLMGQQADELDAFDEFADLYAEDGIDEALPIAVGLAARAAANALGRGTIARLAQPARRALVRGVANTTRQLLRQHGPQAIRALPRVAHSAARVARRRRLPPSQVPAAIQRVGRQVAAQPRLLQQLAQPAGPGLARPAGTAGLSTVHRGGRSFRMEGPVEIHIISR